MNLQSLSYTIVLGTTYHLHGDDSRSTISFATPGDGGIDFAICPLGTTDPTPYWMPGTSMSAQTGPRTFNHIGEVFFRDTAASGNEQLFIVSDTPIVIS